MFNRVIMRVNSKCAHQHAGDGLERRVAVDLSGGNRNWAWLLKPALRRRKSGCAAGSAEGRCPRQTDDACRTMKAAIFSNQEGSGERIPSLPITPTRPLRADVMSPSLANPRSS